MEQERGRRRRTAVVAAVVAAVIAVVAAVALWPREDRAPRAEPAPGPTSTPTPLAPATPAADPCARTLAGGFVPTSLTVPGVVRAPVLAVARDAADVPGTPPLSDKRSFAWDRYGVRPGSTEGHVLLNTHTYPDGSAQGNRLLADLDEGDQVRLADRTGRLACYRVTTREEVPAEDGYPGWKAADGPPELVIVVCSGRRTGPGEWTHRTLWFASPVTSSRPAPEPSSSRSP